MPLCPYDLGRALLVTGALLLACSPVPSEVETTTTGSVGTGDTTGGPGPGSVGTVDDTGDATMGGTEDTGPSFDPVCGDGLVEDPEECDLGPLNGGGMYCTTDCTSNVCGDGYLGPGEACDDGNQNNEDTCTTSCGLATCGDGRVQAGEDCDEGAGNSQTGACLPSCIAASCGDQFIHQGVELCDSNDIGGASCQSEGFDPGGTLLCASDCMSYDTSNCHLCGNGVIEAREDCDGNNYMGGVTCQDYAPGGTTVSGGALACTMGCTTISSDACTFCGDNVREGTEVCDGNQFDGATCASEAPGGQTYSGTGSLMCTGACTMIDNSACTYCGDGVREGTEICDGNQFGAETCVSQGFPMGGVLACNASCMINTSGCNQCGDGMIDPPEECDGAALGGATCASVQGAGHGGVLACEASCTFDTGGCCLNNGQACTAGGQCCSMNCNNPGTGLCVAS